MYAQANLSTNYKNEVNWIILFNPLHNNTFEQLFVVILWTTKAQRNSDRIYKCSWSLLPNRLHMHISYICTKNTKGKLTPNSCCYEVITCISFEDIIPIIMISIAQKNIKRSPIFVNILHFCVGLCSTLVIGNWSIIRHCLILHIAIHTWQYAYYCCWDILCHKLCMHVCITIDCCGKYIQTILSRHIWHTPIL